MERTFQNHMSELYELAFLLTGDRERSVQAYTAALHSEAPAPALQRFMLSWAKRLVIVAALGTIRQQLRARMPIRDRADELTPLAVIDRTRLTKGDLEEVLLPMDAFQRCAVILGILEGLPAKEVADLLGSDEATVKAAQSRGATEMAWRLGSVIHLQPHRSFTCGQRIMAAFG